MTLLSVKNLSIGYETPYGLFTAVDNISFDVKQARPLGIVGESGCGKTTIGMSLMGLLPDNANILSGSMTFGDKDLAALCESQWRKIRGKEIAMIFQAAMNALNPVFRVDDQVREAIVCHNPGMTAAQLDARVKALFELVEIPWERRHNYPHEYSGGMKQRVVIVMALACSPVLVIADEPTTALDVVVQDQILKGLRRIQAQVNTGLIFISHDIAVVASVCDDVCVMYGGQIMEKGTVKEVFTAPRHPYTRTLLSAYLSLDNINSIVVPEIDVPLNHAMKDGLCRYMANCRLCCKKCGKRIPTWTGISSTHSVLCCEEVIGQVK